MELEAGLVLALIVLPVLGGLLTYLTRGAGLKAIVLLTSISVAVISLILLGDLLINDMVTVNIGSDELEGLETVIPVLDALLGRLLHLCRVPKEILGPALFRADHPGGAHLFGLAGRGVDRTRPRPGPFGLDPGAHHQPYRLDNLHLCVEVHGQGQGPT